MTILNMLFLDKIQSVVKNGHKLFALLIDPGKLDNNFVVNILKLANLNKVDVIFIGGSLVSISVDEIIETIKLTTKIPVFLFPGNVLQLSNKADGILLLSLISGRNPELLIGNHVIAAPFLKKSGIEVVPIGYILIENGKSSSVSYMSNTRPIPSDKPDIAATTALAGELLGLKMIYLEAGSGALNPVSVKIIEKVRSEISIPIIVGGGIKTTKQLKNICSAGADIIVIGNSIEANPLLLEEFVNIVHSY